MHKSIEKEPYKTFSRKNLKPVKVQSKNNTKKKNKNKYRPYQKFITTMMHKIQHKNFFFFNLGSRGDEIGSEFKRMTPVYVPELNPQY